MGFYRKRLIIIAELILILVLSVLSFLRSKKTNENSSEYEENDGVSEEVPKSLIKDISETPTPTSTPDSGNVYYLDIILTVTPASAPISTITSMPRITVTPTPKPTTISNLSSVSAMYPERISLGDLHTVTLGKNATRRIYVMYEPEEAINKKITWSVDNESVLRVTEDGLITGIDIGIATVKITSENGLTDEMKIQVINTDTEEDNSY